MKSLRDLRERRKNVRSSSLHPLESLKQLEKFLYRVSESLSTAHVYRNTNMALQPRGGLSTLDKQNELWHSLKKAGSDILPLTIDSNTRQNDYSKASYLHKKALLLGEDTLNGFPLISVPFEKTREAIVAHGKPISLRHGTPDANLLVETALSCGILEIEGGAISYCLPYSKNYPLQVALANWKYVDNVCAYYNNIGIPIVRESFGPLTSTLVPPIICISVQLLELEMAIRNGVQYFSVSLGQTGSLEQDIAMFAALRSLVDKLLDKLGALDLCSVNYVYHQWMGAFPIDPIRANQLLTYANICACLVFADKVVLKTRDEALGVPTIQANSDAVLGAKYVRDSFSLIGIKIRSDKIDEECETLTQEVSRLMDSIFADKSLSINEAVFSAVKCGCLDIPYSPHMQNTGLLSARRANDGSIRVYEAGNCPLSFSYLERERSILNEVRPYYDDLDSIVGMILHYASIDDIA